MGISPVSCNCGNTCKDTPNEVEFSGGEHLRTKSGNLKLKKELKNLEINSKSKITSNLFKQENLDNENNPKKYINNVKETIQSVKNENSDEEENKHLNIIKHNIIKPIITFGDRNNESSDEDFLENNSKKEGEDHNFNEGKNEINNKKSSIKYIPNFDKAYFYPKKLINAEKNFLQPLNYVTDYQKYFQDDEDNIDMLILINTMNNNKGINHTKEDGEVIEYKGEKYLYIGETDKNQMPTGFGVLYTQDQKYEGNFFRGKLTGIGRYINEKGTCFEGIFEDNKLVSKATIITINKDNKRVEYFGDVVDFKKNGKGEEVCEDEYRYTGEFSNDLKHGYGKIEFFENDETYEGHFEKGEINGKGLYTWGNGEQYKGTFLNGIKHGKGVYTWPDGCRYIGEYNKGIREGKGKYIWEDGRVFSGLFSDGKPNGKGKITFKGKTFICEYKNGKPNFDIKKLFKNT